MASTWSCVVPAWALVVSDGPYMVRDDPYMYIVYKHIVGLAKLPNSPILDTIGDLQ